jgi:hypothetical protein
MFASALVGLLCLALAAALRSRLLFVIAAICWVQNLVLPWWYTQGWIGAEAARSLVVVKELLLAVVLAYAAGRAAWVWRRPLPAPVVWLLAYGVWAVLRIGLGLALGDESLVANLRLVRSVLFPVGTVLAGFLVGLLAPTVPARYVRFTVAGIAVCAAVSLALYFLPSDEFWLNEVNIAAYNVEVKGDLEWTVLSNLGVSGSAAGRLAFQALSAFRLFGTFGDPLTAGMVLGLAVLALAARPRLSPGTLGAAALIAAALFLTFSRSAWVLAGVGFTYLALTQRRPGRLLAVAGAAAVLWLAVAPLRQFVFTTLAAFEFETSDVYHALAILNFYSPAMLRVENLLGAGALDATAQTWVLENGLAYLTVQFGLPALVTFVGLCVSAERYLRRRSAPEELVPRLGAACALASLVVANFSFYALSFTAYFGIWSIVGLGIGMLHRREVEGAAAVPADAAQPPAAAADPSA